VIQYIHSYIEQPPSLKLLLKLNIELYLHSRHSNVTIFAELQPPPLWSISSIDSLPHWAYPILD